MPSENGWKEYQKLVLAELTRLDESVQSLHDEVEGLRISVEVLRQKAVTWGALGGLIVWVTTVVGAALVK